MDPYHGSNRIHSWTVSKIWCVVDVLVDPGHSVAISAAGLVRFVADGGPFSESPNFVSMELIERKQ